MTRWRILNTYIAVGGCAISGGPFKKSYHVLNGVDKILPVDVYLPGCPPRPEALLYGMIQLQRKVKLEKFFGGVNRKENEPQKSRTSMSERDRNTCQKLHEEMLKFAAG